MARNKRLKTAFRGLGASRSLDVTGTTDRIGARQPNLRALMKQRIRILELRRSRDAAELSRLNAAITALGKRRKGE